MVILKDIYPDDAGITGPVCLAGAMAAPPEECGGIEGYNRLKRVMANSKHPEYAYVSELIAADKNKMERFTDAKEIEVLQIESLFNTKLNKLKRSNPEVLFLVQSNGIDKT